MVAVHALVAEILANLIHTLKTAHDQSFEVQLSGDAHIHRDIERIEVGDKRPGCSATGDSLQRRRLDLGITSIVKHLAHGFHY